MSNEQKTYLAAKAAFDKIKAAVQPVLDKIDLSDDTPMAYELHETILEESGFYEAEKAERVAEDALIEWLLAKARSWPQASAHAAAIRTVADGYKRYPHTREKIVALALKPH